MCKYQQGYQDGTDSNNQDSAGNNNGDPNDANKNGEYAFLHMNGAKIGDTPVTVYTGEPITLQVGYNSNTGSGSQYVVGWLNMATSDPGNIEASTSSNGAFYNNGCFVELAEPLQTNGYSTSKTPPYNNWYMAGSQSGIFACGLLENKTPRYYLNGLVNNGQDGYFGTTYNNSDGPNEPSTQVGASVAWNDGTNISSDNSDTVTLTFTHPQSVCMRYHVSVTNNTPNLSDPSSLAYYDLSTMTGVVGSGDNDADACFTVLQSPPTLGVNASASCSPQGASVTGWAAENNGDGGYTSDQVTIEALSGSTVIASTQSSGNGSNLPYSNTFSLSIPSSYAGSQITIEAVYSGATTAPYSPLIQGPDPITIPACPNVSCTNVTLNSPLAGTSNGVIGGSSFSVTVTLHNNDPNNTAPASYGGGNLSASVSANNNVWYNTPYNDWFPNYIGQSIPPGGTIQVSISNSLFGTPAGIGSYVLSMYSDYTGVPGEQQGCPPLTIDVYQPFTLTTYVTDPAAQEEDPTSVPYNMGVNNSASTGADADSQLSTLTKNGAPIPGPYSNSTDGPFTATTLGPGSLPIAPVVGDNYCGTVEINGATATTAGSWNSAYLGPHGPTNIVDKTLNTSVGVGPTYGTYSTNCLLVVNEPYVHFFGSDVMAGDCSNEGGAIDTFNEETSTGTWQGSGSELAALSLGQIQGFSSAFLRTLFPTPPIGLTFANTGSGVDTSGTAGTSNNGNLGGDFDENNFCSTNYYQPLPSGVTYDKTTSTVTPGLPSSLGGTGTTPTNGAQSTSTGAGGATKIEQYYDATSYPNSTLTIKGSITNNGQMNQTNFPNNTDEIIYVNGNVYIDGNICYGACAGDPEKTNPSWSSPTAIPSLFIVTAPGYNIYIDPSVTELDGVYIAEPSSTSPNPNTAGYIDTCANASGALGAAAIFGSNNTCGKQLVVYGAFIAQNIFLNRTYSSLRFAQFGENPQSPNPSHNCGTASTNTTPGDTAQGASTSEPDCAAEIFDFSPELYLSQPAITPSSNSEYLYVESLPPVL